METLQIVWHDKLPVLSGSFYNPNTLLTAGADHEVKVLPRSQCKLGLSALHLVVQHWPLTDERTAHISRAFCRYGAWMYPTTAKSQ